jgi:Zn-finger nucleic acid-binding protein
MQCPSDGTVLVMSERSGIEIDYCPTCRGVWLDRGELDKIVERASREFAAPVAGAPAAPAAPAQPQPPAPAYGQPAYQQPGYDNRGDRGYDNRGYDNRGYGDQGYRKKKKESWLSELFD